MVTGGGGLYDETQPKDTDGNGSPDVFPLFSGGGGGGQAGGGVLGGGAKATKAGIRTHGAGGLQSGPERGYAETVIWASGGAGGGGGGADDDGGGYARGFVGTV
jgi:hypothetical protein